MQINRVELILKVFRKAQDSLVIQPSDLSLGTLSDMSTSSPTKKAPIDLAPDFQRRDRWHEDKQSALIESFLLNIPVPPIYLSEDEYGQYSVVDGKQRLTAISNFMNSKLRLKNLERFIEIEGLSFNELPDDLQNALKIRPYVRVITILKQSDSDLKLEVFSRLNRGGEDMLDQEIRKVAYRGKMSSAIYEEAEASRFLRKQLKITAVSSPAYRRMEDAEYVLRFLALRGGWREFSGSMKSVMDDFMKTNQNETDETISEHIASFKRALDACERIWEGNAFQRFAETAWRDQFLGGIYDAEMLAISELSNDELTSAIDQREIIIERTKYLFTNDSLFDKYTRISTNTPSYIRYRIEKILEILRAN